MGGKLDWKRAKPGHGGYDSRTGTEWRSTHSKDEVFEFNDRNPDLLAPPNIYWAAWLRRCVPERDGKSLSRLENLAASIAAKTYRLYGVNTLMTRVEQFHARASSMNPFPSAWFAAYFDFAARKIVLSHREHDPRPTRLPSKFFSYRSVSARIGSRSEVHRDYGGFLPFWNAMTGQNLKPAKQEFRGGKPMF